MLWKSLLLEEINYRHMAQRKAHTTHSLIRYKSTWHITLDLLSNQSNSLNLSIFSDSSSAFQTVS
jgi:hypothetical protein